jgi:hypothetical protein
MGKLKDLAIPGDWDDMIAELYPELLDDCGQPDNDR